MDLDFPIVDGAALAAPGPVAPWEAEEAFGIHALERSAAPGLWWCAGQGGYGFRTSPAAAPPAAAPLADLVAGRAPALGAPVAALDPRRFG